MNKLLVLLFLTCLGVNSIKASYLVANNQIEPVIKDNNKSNINPRKEKYILGPGDSLVVSVIGIPELSGRFFIGPDGYMYLPEIDEIYASEITVQELKELLIIRYEKYVNNPDIFVRISEYRPVKVYITGEVQRPGYYKLNGVVSGYTQKEEQSLINNLSFDARNTTITSTRVETDKSLSIANRNKLFPSVFDAIRASQGITSYSDLSKIKVIRNNPKSLGGGKVSTELNFLSLFTNGDQSQNIRIFDGDTIIVSKSDEILKDQIINANKTNLSPDLIQVYVTGNVVKPGAIKIPQGSGLNQALSMVGGKKILSGRVEFLRFSQDGLIERRDFSYNQLAKINSRMNPILMTGDIINVKRSVLGYTTAVVGEVTRPLVGIYSLYNLIDDIKPD